MNHNRSPIFFYFLIAALVLTACATPAAKPTDTAAPPTSTPVPPTETASPIPPTLTSTPVPTDTPIPPTPTFTRTPRPTATPTPGPGDAIFTANFADLSDWNDFAFSFATGNDTDNYTFETQSQNLYVEVPEKNTSVYGFYAVDMPQADVQIDVDVETVAGPNENNVSVVCRANDKGWYELSIHSGGLWVIYRYEEGSAGYTELASGGSTAIHMQKEANHLTVLCVGPALTFYINNVKVTTVKDNKFKTGYVGVSASSFDIGGVGIEFGNFVVRVPDLASSLGGETAPTVVASGDAGATPRPAATTSAATSVYSATGGGPQGYTSYLGCTQVDGSPCQSVMAPGDISFSITLQSDADALLAIFLPFGLAVEKDGANAADMYMTVDAGWLPPSSQARFGTSHRFTQPGHYIIRTNGCLMTEASYPNCSWWTVNGTVVTFDIQP